jgi:hypothetical protein
MLSWVSISGTARNRNDRGTRGPDRDPRSLVTLAIGSTPMGERGELLAVGREAEVFLQADGTILKLMREPASADRVDHEATALRVLERGGHAAPRALEVVTVDGRPGLVMTRVDGEDLMTVLGRQPLSFRRAAKAMAREHLAMHECLAPPELPDLHDVLRERIEVVEALPDELRGPALAVLDRLPRGDRLCHGDLTSGTWSARGTGRR